MILVDDGVVWISCQSLVVKVEGYSPQSAAFEKASMVIVKGLTLVQALRGRVGAKGCWRIFSTAGALVVVTV